MRVENAERVVINADADGRFPVQPGRRYLVRATVGPEPEPAAMLAPIVIQDGDPADRVPFTVGLVGGRVPPGSEERSLELVGSAGSATVDFPFELGNEGVDMTLWVRLMQRGRLIQLVELDLNPLPSPA